MVATLRPTTRPIVRMGMRVRRNPSMRSMSSPLRIVRVLRHVRPGALIEQTRIAQRLEALLPLPRRAQADAGGLGRRHQPHRSNALDQQLATLYVVLAFLWLFIRADPSESLKRR